MKYGLDYSYITILVYKYYYLYTNIGISILIEKQENARFNLENSAKSI